MNAVRFGFFRDAIDGPVWGRMHLHYELQGTIALRSDVGGIVEQLVIDTDTCQLWNHRIGSSSDDFCDAADHALTFYILKPPVLEFHRAWVPRNRQFRLLTSDAASADKPSP